MQQTKKLRVFFLGAGSVSEALIKGLLTAQLLPAEQITISNRKNSARLDTLQRRYGVHISQDKQADCAQANLVILAAKPFDLPAALQEIADAISGEQLVISLAAGISTSTLEQQLGRQVPVIRSMPNTSSSVQASATALCSGKWATSEHLELARQFFSAIGISVVVDEAQMDAVTGLSGSGPAYFYYVVEALLEAAQQCGLPAETARILLVQTIYGAARMLQESGQNPAELRRQVTSPNGTTMAGLSVLEEGGAYQLLLSMVQRATQRSAEMGAQVEAFAASVASKDA
ncbi:MAG TPA: pyrroline-5-carboxylate reductase [Ktedonobacteraceae bacterium]|nr:pyrroline-5-carboxylate reductase [Ktedonobacteraceae bacterium]